VSRLDRMLAVFRRDRAKVVIIELVIVFLGVYGAFALQDYSQQRAGDAEREKVLVGVKEDLEYFRIFFPTFTAVTRSRNAKPSSSRAGTGTTPSGASCSRSMTTRRSSTPWGPRSPSSTTS